MSVESLEEKIRHHAPRQAAGYFLMRQRRDGEPVRYPPHGAFRLNPFTPPSGAPFGSYILYFVRYEADAHAMAPANAAEDFVRIQLIPPGRAESHLPVHADHPVSRVQADGADSSSDSDADDAINTADRMAELEVAIARTPGMISARADFERQRMAMELAENNQELLNKGHFSRDAAEALALNRAYRREAQITMEAQAQLSRRTAEEVQSHWAVFRLAQEAQTEGLRLLKEQLQIFAKPAPPPPPIDYMPAVVEGLRGLRDFGVAMVQARTGVPFSAPAAAPQALMGQSTRAKLVAEGNAPVDEKSPKSATPAQTEGAERAAEGDSDQVEPSTVSAVSGVSAPGVNAVSAVIDSTSTDAKEEASRLLNALGETTELEMLFALLSPEQFQTFLKRLRQRAKAGGRPGDAALTFPRFSGQVGYIVESAVGFLFSKSLGLRKPRVECLRLGL